MFEDVLLAYEVGIALLLVCQGLKVLGDLEPHDTWRGIGKVAGQLLSIHVEKTTMRE